MIQLSSKTIQKEDILSRLSEEDIFRKYCNNFKSIGKSFKSEFRKEGHASCYITHYRNSLIYKDFGEYGCLDCFAYCMKKFNIGFKDCLEMIANDFVIESRQLILKTEYEPELLPNVIKVKSKEFNQEDKQYWQQYNISTDILNRFNTGSLDYFLMNHRKPYFVKYNTSGKAFFTLIDTDEVERFKIYRPEEKDLKWRTNCTANNIMGFKQLPEKGDLLIQTSSNKDIMSLYSLGYNAIAPSSENVIIKEDMMNHLKCRFKKIVTYHNNDEAGIKAAKISKDKYTLPFITNPVIFKDPSDWIKYEGIENISRWLKTALK